MVPRDMGVGRGDSGSAGGVDFLEVGQSFPSGAQFQASGSVL